MNTNEKDVLAIKELKILSIDMINKAGSGNPGIALDMASIMYVLFSRFLNVSPKNPSFWNRDRVILTPTIAPLYYATLHMAGYPITKEDLMNYRRIHHKCPGIPELNNPIGVESSVGYGADNAGISVGLSLSRRYLESLITAEDNKLDLLNFNVYTFLSHQDLLNGTFDEAMSFACAQGLSHLVYFYDDTNVGEDGALSEVVKDNTVAKYSAIGMNVDVIKDSNNLKDVIRSIDRAIHSSKPTLIIVKNIIGKDTFNEGKSAVYSGVLSLDDTSSLRRKYNLFLPQFDISKDSVLHMETQMTARYEKNHKKWQVSYARARDINSESLNMIMSTLEQGKSQLLFASENYKINEGYRESLVLSNYKVMNLFANKSNFFIGGNIENATSGISNIVSDAYMSVHSPQARNIAYGPRPHMTGHILNGMSFLGIRPFVSAKFYLADEMKSAIRMSSLMNTPVTYIFTHDSVYQSEEGPAHIPVEELSMLRSIPNFYVYRPADIIEIMGVWESTLNMSKPCAIILSNNSIPRLPGSNSKEVLKGAYIIKKENQRLDGIIIASGSEVVSAMQISYDLQAKGLDLRVVSMPCMELFKTMGKEYQDALLPKNVKTAVIEAGSGSEWAMYATSSDYILSIKDFAYSGLPIEVLQKMEYDYDSLKMNIETLMR